VNLTPRDRKIIMAIVPLLLLGAYWFMVLAPKREESKTVTEELTEVQGKRDTVQAQVGQLNAAKRSFASDYATVIRMGKAVPESVDMPSLLVQLDRAARGTGIEMKEIVVSPGTTAAGGAAPASTPPGGGGNPGAGGSGAQSPMGKTAQNAGNQVNNANDKSQQAAGGGNAGGATGSSGPQGGDPAAGGGQAAPGLTSVGLQFKLKGDFFDLAEFFHRMKRFVRVANDDVLIRGRLITIDTFNFKPDQGKKRLEAQVGATVYLSPKAQGGVSAGASPSGPGAAPGGATPAGSSPSPSSTPAAPTATATP
jgi:hypothetical protein